MIPLLSFKEVSLSIKGKKLFETFSFTLYKGEKIGLIGPSGSGKSLLLESLLGLCPAKATGKALFYGENLFELSEKALRSIRGSQIALVPQNPFSQLNPTRKVGSQMIEALKIQGMKTFFAKNLAYEMLSSLDLDPEKCFHSYPYELSGGMCQRAVLAMFLLLQPEIFLSDEPTTALDPGSIQTVLQVLEKQKDLSHLFVSHDRKVAERFCDTIIEIHGNRICCLR